MKKLSLFLSVAVLTLSACSPSVKEIDHEYRLPKQLSHCNIYELNNSIGNKIKVVHCPNSDVTVSSHMSGKVRKSTSVIVEHGKS